jgi:hypothetical protein
MSLGATLLQGSHCGSYHDQDNGGNDVTDDALPLVHAIQHAPAELGRDSSSMLLGTSLL